MALEDDTCWNCRTSRGVYIHPTQGSGGLYLLEPLQEADLRVDAVRGQGGPLREAGGDDDAEVLLDVTQLEGHDPVVRLDDVVAGAVFQVRVLQRLCTQPHCPVSRRRGSTASQHGCTATRQYCGTAALRHGSTAS